AAVYRRGGGEWTSLATVECDAAGTVAYDDSTVGGGGPYGYLVVVASERGETFGGETWVDVPGVAGVGPASAPALALNRIVPNPPSPAARRPHRRAAPHRCGPGRGPRHPTDMEPSSLALLAQGVREPLDDMSDWTYPMGAWIARRSISLGLMERSRVHLSPRK